jgi:hypothetical protein
VIVGRFRTGNNCAASFLLADTADGKLLSGSQGRFRLVAAKGKPAARRLRMLTKPEVVQLRHHGRPQRVSC